MAENEHRAEVEITFSGKQMIMRPTFDAIARIEAGTGKGILELAKRYDRGDVSITDTAIILTEGLRAGSEAGGANYQAVGKQLVREGLPKFIAPVGRFLLLCLGGPAEDENPTTETTTETQ